MTPILKNASRLLFLALAAASTACADFAFRRPQSPEEAQAESEIRAYYGEVQQAFAAGDAEALTALFDAGISRPMSRAQILAWGEEFFGRHGGCRFRIENLEFLDIGPNRAVAELTYRVKTPNGSGDFGGTETDVLRKSAGRWLVESWEKKP